MTRASFCVIRLIPDLARNEPVNIGIVAWCQGRMRMRIDEGAISRMLHWAPSFDAELFESFEDRLKERLLPSWPVDDNEVEAYLADRLKLPTIVTPPLFLNLREREELDSALEDGIDLVIDELVAVRRRWSPRHPGIAKPIQDRLRPLLRSNLVHNNYSLSDTRSGRERRVNYFVNSTVQAALDIFDFRADATDETIFARADQQVTKVNDIRGGRRLSEYLLYLPVDQRPSLGSIADEVEHILALSQCTVIRKADDAAEALAAKVREEYPTPI